MCKISARRIAQPLRLVPSAHSSVLPELRRGPCIEPCKAVSAVAALPCHTHKLLANESEAILQRTGAEGEYGGSRPCKAFESARPASRTRRHPSERCATAAAGIRRLDQPVWHARINAPRFLSVCLTAILAMKHQGRRRLVWGCVSVCAIDTAPCMLMTAMYRRCAILRGRE